MVDKTEMLDELEKGPWPSFVSQIKEQAEKNPISRDLLRQLEQSYKDKKLYWRHGGVVGVWGYGSGMIGRYSARPDLFPGVAEFHTVRLNNPSGWFYNTKSLRQMCDIWEKYGSGLLYMHGMTGDILLLGTTTENLQPCFDELSSEASFDLGGSGPGIRTISCCVGPARCEWACYDTLDVTYDLTMTFQSEMHRPSLPHKFKIKCSGCPNDCVGAILRSDLPIIGTWRDTIQIDQEAVSEYINGGFDIVSYVINRCPTQCMRLTEKELGINDRECSRCMHCINVLPKALRPGKERGATILIGGKTQLVEGTIISSVLIPFIKLTPPYQEIKDLVNKIWDFWGEYARGRERVGEFIQRIGLGDFLEGMGIEPNPYMVAHPRENPHIKFEEYYREGD